MIPLPPNQVRFVAKTNTYYDPHIYGRFKERLFLHGFLTAIGISHQMMPSNGRTIRFYDLDAEYIEDLADAFNAYTAGDPSLLEQFAEDFRK